jgi:hypothetical protein
MRQIISAAVVTQVLADLPILGALMQTIYSCSYAQLFVALALARPAHAVLRERDGVQPVVGEFIAA